MKLYFYGAAQCVTGSCHINTSVDVNFSHMAGITPQESASFLHVFSLVVRPMIATGERKRDTIRAVIPESEHATIAFASMSIAIPQVECEMASVILRIWKSAL